MKTKALKAMFELCIMSILVTCLHSADVKSQKIIIHSEKCLGGIYGYLLIFLVVVVVNLLSKSRVDGVRAFKKVWSLLAGDRVQRKRADKVGLMEGGKL